jgi:hypothetical protein
MSGTIDVDTIEHAAADHPALTQLLAGYYHQDWRDEHASSDDALHSFVHDASAETVAAAAGEIDRLLSAGYDDTALDQLLVDGFDCNYVAETEGLTSTQWLTRMRDSLRAAAS